jgi:hypothetical protein
MLSRVRRAGSLAGGGTRARARSASSMLTSPMTRRTIPVAPIERVVAMAGAPGSAQPGQVEEAELADVDDAWWRLLVIVAELGGEHLDAAQVELADQSPSRPARLGLTADHYK